jgi:hypothetical protein
MIGTALTPCRLRLPRGTPLEAGCEHAHSIDLPAFADELLDETGHMIPLRVRKEPKPLVGLDFHASRL